MNLLTLLSKYYYELYKNGVQVKSPKENSRFYISYSLSGTTKNCCEPNIFRFLSITHNFRNKHSLRNTFIRSTNIPTKRRMLNVLLNVSTNGSEATKLNDVKVSNKNLQFMDFLNYLSNSLNFACRVAQHWLLKPPYRASFKNTQISLLTFLLNGFKA